MFTCETCGNEFGNDRPQCPFCGSHRQFRSDNRPTSNPTRTISLKDDLPTVEQALARLRRELDEARASGGKIVKFIHGYGSGGHGGTIRVGVRRVLVGEQRHGRIRAWVPGEDVVLRSSELTTLLNQYPYLKDDVDTRRSNEGITWVIL